MSYMENSYDLYDENGLPYIQENYEYVEQYEDVEQYEEEVGEGYEDVEQYEEDVGEGYEEETPLSNVVNSIDQQALNDRPDIKESYCAMREMRNYGAHHEHCTCIRTIGTFIALCAVVVGCVVIARELQKKE